MKSKLYDCYLDETELLSGNERGISFGAWIDEKLDKGELYAENDLNIEVDFKNPIHSFSDTIQVSNKYFIAKINQETPPNKYEMLGWEEIEGKPVILKGFEHLDLFSINLEDRGFQIIEGRSGIELEPKEFGFFNTEKEAIEYTEKQFNLHGSKNLEYHFMLHVREYGLCPRYIWDH